MANADISLLFGVLGEGSLSGESGSLIQGQLTQIMAALNKNPLKVKVALDTEKGGQKSWSSQLQTKLNEVSSSGKFSVQVSKLTLGTGAITDFRNQLNAVINTLHLDKGTSITLTAEGIGEIKSKMKQAGDAASDAARKTAEFKVQMEALNRQKTSVQRALSSLSATATTNEEKAKVAELTAQYEQWAIKIEQIRATKTAATGTYRAELEAEGAAISENITRLNEERVAAETAAASATAAASERAAAEEAAASATEHSATAGKDAAAAQKDLDAARKQGLTLLTQMQKAERDWTSAKTGKSSAEYGQIQDSIRYLQTYLAQLKSGEIDVTTFRQHLTELSASFASSSNAIKLAGENTRTFSERIGGLAKKFSAWFSVTRVIMTAINTIRKMVQNTKDIDASMTQLRIVTGATDAEMEAFLVKSTSLAKELGQSITNVLGSIETFSRLGYNLADASELAEFANVLANVAAVDTDAATTGLTSIIKGFNMDVSEAEHVADVLVEVGQKYAVSAGEMMEAYEKSGAALNAANTSFEKSAGLIAAANASVQNASTVGTALKTISARIRGAKSDLEALGEDTSELAEGFSKYAKEIKALIGFDIMVDGTTNTYKDIYDIFEGISKVWDDLSDTQQARVSEILGGTRQLQVVSSILGNWKDSAGAYADAMASAGTATEANATYMDSINGKIGVFNATFQEFSNNLFSSGLIKFFVELGTAILSALNALEELHLLLPMVVSVVVAIKGIRAGLAAMNGAIAAAETASAINTIVARLIAEKSVTDALAVSVANLSIAEKAELATKIQAAVASGSLTAAEGQQILATLGLVTAEGTLTVANHSLAASFKALMASIPVWGWIALGISAVITAITALSGSFKSSEEKLEELNNEFDELISNTKTISSEFRTLKQSADEVIPRFAELAKGVNEFGENVSLTDEEYEEFLALNNRIAEMFPELDNGLDSNGNHILSLSYSVDTLTESLNALVEAERIAANEKIAGNMGDALENLKKQDEEYNKQLDKLNERKQGYEEARAELERMYNSKDKYQEAYGDRWEDIYQLDTSSVALVDKLQRAFGTVGDSVDAEKWQNMVEQFVIDEEGMQIDWYAVVNSKEFKNAMAGLDREIENEQKKQSARWAEMRPIMGAWLQTTDDYTVSSDNTKNVLEKVIGNIDYASIGITNEAKLKSYIEESYIKPITESAPEVQNALAGLFDIKSAFDAGALTVGEYGIADYILGDLQKAGISDDILVNVKASLNLDDFKEQLAAVKSGIEGTQGDIDEFVNGLSVTDFDIVYDIISENGSMSIDELQEKLDKLRYESSAMVNPLDFSGFTKDLNEAADSVNDLVSAMNKLAEGTELSKRELMELIEKYPELLKQADLFADGNVDAQKNALNTILDMQEQEYDAQIDAKIAELKATEQVLDDQLALEEQKANLINDIKNMEVNGKITQEEEFIGKLNELNDLQGQNFVKLADGEVQVNEEALNDQLEQGYDYGQKATDNIWEPLGETIVSSHEQGYTGALTATNNYTSSLWQRIKNFFSNIGSAIAQAWSDMWAGQWKGLSAYFGANASTGVGDVSGGVVSVNFGGSKTTVNGQGVDEWVSTQEEASKKRIEKIEQIKADTLTAIDNLEKLKGLNLTDIYAKESSGSSSKSGSKDATKEVEEYIADLDEYYAALKRLESIQLKLSTVQNKIENAQTSDEKIALTKELISIYHDEADALENLNNLRSATIKAGIKDLEELGFQVEYNAKTNEFYVKNLEHLNELQATSKGEYDSLQEATNALREKTEDLVNTLDELNTSNQDGVNSMREAAQSIKDAKDSIVEYLQEIVDEANEVVDGFQDVYTTLTDAAKEYAQNGFLSVDSLQAILELGPKYLEFLYNENGQLVLNEQSLQRVIAAKTEEMAAETALSYAKQVLLAAEQAEADTLVALTQANATASTSTWNMAYATLGLAKAIGVANGMDAGYFDDAVTHIQKMQSLSKTAVNSISAYYKTLDEGYISQKDGLNQILELTKDMIRHENEDMIDALEGQKDAFADIVQLRKEALEAAKKEGDYNDEIEEKIRKIAKLQERINTLSLDDSRDAQAEKIKLEEEMYELQKELADLQADHALDAQTSALDKVQTAFEDQKDDEIAALEDTLSSEEKLYQAAIARINQGWDELYQDLLSWNYEYGSTLQSELVSAWDAASEAVQRYGSFVDALEGVQSYTNLGNYDTPSAESGSQTYGSANSIINQMRQNSVAYWAATDAERVQINANQLALAEQYRRVTGDNIERVDGSWFHDDGSRLYSLNKSEVVSEIVARMKQNGAAYGNASASKKKELSDENLVLGSRLGSYLGKNVYRDSNGVWWIEGRHLFDVYHRGGIAGGNATLKQDEVMAILKKGEPVLDEKREQALYRIIDFTTALSERLGKAISSTPLAGSLVTAKSGLPDLQDAALESITNNQNETVHFGDVYIYGANEETVERHREVNRQFTNEVLRQLNIKK